MRRTLGARQSPRTAAVCSGPSAPIRLDDRARRLGIAPPATRQAPRRLAARGHIDRLANGQRGRYAISDRLFRRYLELQTCER